MLNSQILAAIVLPLATTALLVSPVQAFAQVEERRAAVAYGDLDLSKPAGVARLSRRVTIAIREVCAVSARPLLRELSDQRACVAQAHAAAAPQVERAVAMARTGRFLAQAEASQTPRR